jgi:hypothetical protein
MNKHEFFQKYNIDRSAEEIVSDIENRTKKEMVFIEKPDLEVRATIKMARKNMSNHFFYAKNFRSEAINHLVVHECAHVLRISSAQEKERLAPAIKSENIIYYRVSIDKSLPKIFKEMPKETLEKILDFWLNGIIRQLTNLPVDYRIEYWIYSSFPNLRKTQKESVENDLKASIQSLSKEVKEIIPIIIFEKSYLMNYAYTRLIDKLLGTNYLPYYKNLDNLDEGDKLASLLETEDKGYNQDIDTINCWAEILNLSNWFAWINFEQIPDDYLNVVI